MSLSYRIDNVARVSLLKKILAEKGHVKILEAHNGLSGLIVNSARLPLETGGVLEFDGLWESSLTDSASKGHPDIEVVSFDSRLDTVQQILEVTDKPMIVDGDTGGDVSQFEYTVKKLERAGVSMVIIEDKVFPKRNSLESGTRQVLENPLVFGEKIKRGQAIKMNPDFMIVGRIESFIAGFGLADALERATVYLEHGADGIMIHSKSSQPDEILEFARHFYELPKALIEGKVLVCVPTTYNTITDRELFDAGFHVVIHANQLLRAAYKSMEQVAQKILAYDRSFEADSDGVPVRKIFEAVGFLDVTAKDKSFDDKLKSKIKVIIPAAGKNDLASEMKRPVSLIEIQGKTILERQLDALSKNGLNNIAVVRGYEGAQFKMENLTYYDNPDFDKKHILHSLFLAEPEMNGPFIVLHSDILFHESLIRSLIDLDGQPDGDIILVVDSSYLHTDDRAQKPMDLVRTRRSTHEEPLRHLGIPLDEDVAYIGKKMNKDVAHYEFAGIAYFSERGGTILKEVYHDSLQRKAQLQESSNVQNASLTDLLQEVVDRGHTIKILKTYKGWMEVHTAADIQSAGAFYS